MVDFEKAEYLTKQLLKLLKEREYGSIHWRMAVERLRDELNACLGGTRNG